ncbi:E3 ubiquitin-protein ligase SMURF2 isoform X3 [Lissotriton helveticus]
MHIRANAAAALSPLLTRPCPKRGESAPRRAARPLTGLGRPPPGPCTSSASRDMSNQGVRRNGPVKLRLTVLCAKNLVKKDFFRLPDPFAKVVVDGSGQCHSTDTVKNTLDPKWNQHYDLYIGKSDSITISVWNHKKIHKKQGAGFLGCVRLLCSAINRLKDTGYQRLDLCKLGPNDNDTVRGQIVETEVIVHADGDGTTITTANENMELYSDNNLTSLEVDSQNFEDDESSTSGASQSNVLILPSTPVLQQVTTNNISRKRKHVSSPQGEKEQKQPKIDHVNRTSSSHSQTNQELPIVYCPSLAHSGSSNSCPTCFSSDDVLLAKMEAMFKILLLPVLERTRIMSAKIDVLEAAVNINMDLLQKLTTSSIKTGGHNSTGGGNQNGGTITTIPSGTSTTHNNKKPLIGAKSAAAIPTTVSRAPTKEIPKVKRPLAPNNAPAKQHLANGTLKQINNTAVQTPLSGKEKKTPHPERNQRTDYRNTRHPPRVNLPPEASQYTIVLTGVAPLREGIKESQGDLRNKVTFWLNKHRPLPPSSPTEILHVRRVDWVGKGEKDLEGDCILISFKDPWVVDRIQRKARFARLGDVQTLHLGYFYPHMYHNYPIGPNHWKSRGGRPREPITPYPPYYPPLFNHFEALSDLEWVD